MKNRWFGAKANYVFRWSKKEANESCVHTFGFIRCDLVNILV